MALSALDSLRDAYEATERLLRPFERAVWLRLAVVLFFLGAGSGGVNVPTVPFRSIMGGPSGSPRSFQPVMDGGSGSAGPPTQLSPEAVRGLVAVALVVLAVVGLLALLYFVVGSIMEFVFVESLRRREVRLRGYLTDRWRDGLRLFGFRLAVFLGNLLLVGGFVLALVGAALGFSPSTWDPAAVVGVAAVVVPVVALDVVLVGNVLGFTTVFVVPIVVGEGCGVLAGWRRLLATMRREWREFVVYAVVGFLLLLAANVAHGVLALVAAVVVAVPFLVVGVPLFLVLQGTGLAGPLVLVGGLTYGLAALTVALLARVPFETYLRYYALLVLGDADGRYDLVPDLRDEIRGV